MRSSASTTNIPLFSILDPSYTYSLPDYQIACGIADSFIHVVEQYLTRVGESPLMDRWAEGILLTLIEEADKIKAQPADYDARAPSCSRRRWHSMASSLWA